MFCRDFKVWGREGGREEGRRRKRKKQDIIQEEIERNRCSKLPCFMWCASWVCSERTL